MEASGRDIETGLTYSYMLGIPRELNFVARTIITENFAASPTVMLQAPQSVCSEQGTGAAA